MQVFHSHHLVVIPLGLTTVRVLLAPLMILLALHEAEQFSFVICLSSALVSDIFDGVIARHLGLASDFLRRYDSTADTVFYLAAGYVVWILYPEALRSNLSGLVCLLGLELTRYAVDFYKFRRETSYHMWSAKCWNLILFAALVAMLGFGFAGWLLAAAIWVGIVSDLEGLFATLLMPKWVCDVPTVWHAYRIRKLSGTPALNNSFNPTPR